MSLPARPWVTAPFHGLAQSQDDVVSRQQLRCVGVDRHIIRNQVAALRWQTLGPRVVVLHRGPLSYRQRSWVALLNAGGGAMLAGRTALVLAGLRGESQTHVDVLAPRANRVQPAPGVRLRRCRAEPVRPIGWPPRQPPAAAAFHVARRARSLPVAGGVLAAVVQQRLVRADELRTHLVGDASCPHRRTLLGVVGDIEGGAHAFAELDFARLCRRAGLPPPRRQAVRLDADGRRRYLDVDLEGLLIEVDGAPHLDIRRQTEDCFRQNERTLQREPLLRFTGLAARTEQERVIAQLHRGLAIRGLRGGGCADNAERGSTYAVSTRSARPSARSA